MLAKGNRMKPGLRALSLSVLLFLSSAAAGNCTGEQIKFSFASISAHTAFSLIADFAGLELDMDKTINRSEPVKFDCMHWRKAASFLAREFKDQKARSNKFRSIDIFSTIADW